MKRNYLNKTKTGLKSLLAGLFLLGTFVSTAQCNALFTYTLGANGTVSLTSTSNGTTISTAYSWNFGSSTQNGTTAMYQYGSNGYKVVCLTIVSNTASPSPCTSTKCDSILITNLPGPTVTPCNANFSFSYGPNGVVHFASTSTGTTVSTNYSWSFGNSTTGTGSAPSQTYTTNGYKIVCLTITNSVTSCTSTKCDSVWITNITPTVTPCQANFNYVLGPNGSVSFASTSTGTTGSTNYSWSFGSSGSGQGSAPHHTFTTNGVKMICLTITNAGTSCTSTACDSLLITNVGGTVAPCTPTVMFTLSKDSTIALTWNAFPFYPSNITGATWNWGDGNSTTGLYPSHTYSAAGSYDICVTVSVSCSTVTATYCYMASVFRSGESTDMILVNVRQSETTGISNQSKEDDRLSIYPNPNNGSFTIDLGGSDNAKEAQVYIYNMLGELVFSKNVSMSGKQNMDVNELNNGTYFVKIISEQNCYSKKINVQK